MIEGERNSRCGQLLLWGALSSLLFLASCGKKEAGTESTGGSAETPAAVAPELPVNVPRELQEYKDPKGAFVVMLPKGYVLSDKSAGDKPKYIFTYGSSVTLILTEGVAEPTWDSAAELAKKQDEIRTGRAGFPPPMVLVERGVLSFGGLKGFQTLLSGNLAGQETQMKAYYLVGDEKLFTLIVTWKDPAAGVLYEQVQSTITNSFRLASLKPPLPVPPKPAVAPVASSVTTTTAPVAVKSSPAPAAAPVTNVTRQAAPVVEKAKPTAVVEPAQPVDPRTEPEWAAAKAMLKFTGSMKMGGQKVAMVNDKILRKDDTISVTFHDKEFTFIVTVISANGVEYKRDLKQ